MKTAHILPAAALTAGLLLSGCGSEKPAKKPPPAAAQADPAPAENQQPVPAPPAKKDESQWYNYGPGDPRGAIRAKQRAQDAAKKMEESRKDPPEEGQE